MAVIEEEVVRRGMSRPTPTIPGIEVSERRMTASDARQFARDPGPGNPRVTPAGSPEAQAYRQGATTQPANTRLGFAGRVGQAVAGGKVPAASAALGLGGVVEGAKVVDTATAPGSTGLDVGQQVAEGAGRLASAGLGAKAGAALGALGGPLAPITVPLGAAAGGAAGYWGAGKLMEKGREAAGTDPRAAVDRVTATPQAAPAPSTPAVAATATPVGAGQGRGSGADPNRTDVDPTNIGFGRARDFSRELASVPRELPADMRDGVVLKTKDANGRTVYSGRNVGEGAQMVDGMGRGMQSRGTVSTVPGMAPGEARAILDRPFDPRNAMNPAQRAQYDAEVATAQAINQHTRDTAGGRRLTVGDYLQRGMQRRDANIAKTESDIATSGANVALGMRRQADSELTSAASREQTQVSTESARQLQALQAEYLSADTDAKRNAAAKKIQALQGKADAPNRYTVVPGGSSIDPVSGMVVQNPSMVLDNASGQLVDLGAGAATRGAQAGKANPYPEGTRLQGPGGKTYVVRDGKPVEE